MASKSSYYDKPLFLFKNAPAFTPLLMIIFGLLARQGYADSRFYSGDVEFVAIVTVYLIASILTIRYTAERRSPGLLDIAMFVAFHVLTALFIFFVGGFLSTFLVIWILLIIGSEIRFDGRGLLASLAALCATAGVFLIIYPDLVYSEKLEILQSTLAIGVIAFIISRIRSITERERARLAKMRQQEIYQRERLMALVNSMGDAVIATDESGIIKVYNSTFLNLLDTNLDLTGRSINTVLKLQDSKDRHFDLIKEAAARHTVFSRSDLAHQFSDGDIVRLYVNVAPIQPGYRSGGERGFIFILRDITKEKSLEDERDEFVSVVSHELRTPVTIAEGNLSNIKLMFEHNVDPKAIIAAVDNSHEQIVYLAKLVNDLSTLARAERGTAGGIEPIDVPTMLNEIFAEYQPQAEAKKLSLNLDLAPKLGQVYSNKLYMQEIIQNLVTNSLKYTKEGSIIIRGTQTKDFVAVSIADTGIGISKADQKRIFEKFYRSEDYRTRESTGTGLGLYVCKKLAEKVGLKIEFESRLNHGSTFTLIIPLTDPPKEATSHPPVATPTPDNIHSAPSS